MKKSITIDDSTSPLLGATGQSKEVLRGGIDQRKREAGISLKQAVEEGERGTDSMEGRLDSTVYSILEKENAEVRELSFKGRLLFPFSS